MDNQTLYKAANACQAFGNAKLASITDKASNEYIKGKLDAASWIGGKKTETKENLSSYDGKRTTAYENYSKWAWIIVEFLIPLAILSVLNFFLVRKINEVNRKASTISGPGQIPSSQAHRRGVTKMVVAV